MPVTLVPGGARCGKTRSALSQAEATPSRRVTIAEAEALDAAAAERIARPRAERSERWRPVEAPLDLPDALRRLEPGTCAAVDRLTLPADPTPGATAHAGARFRI